MDIASDAPQSRYFQSQGLKLHFTDWGNASAPPLLLVHGGLDHSRSWDHLAQALRGDFHVMAPDLRGHGDSGWATGSSYSLADHVYDLTGLMKSEGFDKVSIVGHSMGGMVSLTYAGAFPDTRVETGRARRRHQFSGAPGQTGRCQDRGLGRRSRQVRAAENPSLSVGRRRRRADARP